MNKSILLVDDEPDILEVMSYNLIKQGFDIVTAKNGKEVFKHDLSTIDLIILDIMIPGMNGYEICRKLKRDPATSSIPVIFLTAKNTEIDEVAGLELGADDYITKPISIAKLLARINLIFRREKPASAAEEIIAASGISIDPNNYSVKIKDRDIPLTKKEFEALMILVKHRGTIVRRETLINTLWGNEVIVGGRTIDVHIRRVREKLGSNSALIETVKGIGYRFKDEE
jgi:DNA-binding response OmpR family regulator